MFAGWVAPHNPFDLATLELSDARLPPAWSPGHPPNILLGTDDQGRDILSALIYGARISLVVGLASVVLSVMVGVALGLLAGFGRLDRCRADAPVRRDAVVPAILVALLIAGVGRALFPNAHESLAFGVLILSITLTGWVQYARTVRGSTLVERNKEYVQAARVTGVAPLRIMRKHVLPNVHGAGAGAGHHPGGHGHHHRGHAVLPGRGRAAHIALAGHADPHRQRLPVLGRVVDHRLPGRSCWS
jgi:peptide/nickel transport system permease protein